MTRLERDFFDRDVATVARDLLGRELVRVLEGENLRGRIVETEAYYGEADPPSHASTGKTDRSKIMWEKAGLIYVYLIYGIHFMFNIVCGPRGKPGAVLVRAVEPIEGMEKMMSNRGKVGEKWLTDGPGKLTQAYGIGREVNGRDLVTSEELWLEAGTPVERTRIETSGRVGISEGREEELRFFLSDSPFVSS